MSCLTSSFCVALDVLGRALHYEGHSWSSPTAIDTVGAGPLSVSCPVSGRCIAVDGDGAVLVFENSVWSRPVTIDPNGRLTSVTCKSGTLDFCVAVDSNGNALVSRNPFELK